jgi:hypothetical protein
MKAASVGPCSRPCTRTPVHRSSPCGCTVAMASATLCGRSPPASHSGSGRHGVADAAAQCPVVRAAGAAQLLHRQRPGCRCRAAARRPRAPRPGLGQRDRPVTWITCTSSTPGHRPRRRRSSASGTWSTSCSVVVPAAACCAAMSSACVRAVSRKVAPARRAPPRPRAPRWRRRSRPGRWAWPTPGPARRRRRPRPAGPRPRLAMQQILTMRRLQGADRLHRRGRPGFQRADAGGAGRHEGRLHAGDGGRGAGLVGRVHPASGSPPAHARCPRPHLRQAHARVDRSPGACAGRRPAPPRPGPGRGCPWPRTMPSCGAGTGRCTGATGSRRGQHVGRARPAPPPCARSARPPRRCPSGALQVPSPRRRRRPGRQHQQLGAQCQRHRCTARLGARAAAGEEVERLGHFQRVAGRVASTWSMSVISARAGSPAAPATAPGFAPAPRARAWRHEGAAAALHVQHQGLQPGASFLLRMLAVMSGTLSTVAVTSRMA